MRIYRVIFISIIITILATGYVHQRVEIIKAGYDLQKTREYLARLVDQNSKLMYNLSKVESPRYLLASLNSEEIEFANHRTGQADRCELTQEDSDKVPAMVGFIGRFFDLFTLNAEARSRE
ncbi:hypothetical protein ACFL5Y_00350 [Candidatus Omnitrophota bacterium]